MNALYLIVLVVASVPKYHPICRPTTAYPHVMSYASLLFIFNYIFLWVVFCNKEFFLKPIEDEHTQEVNQQRTQPNNTTHSEL